MTYAIEKHPLLTPEWTQTARHILILPALQGTTVTYTKLSMALEAYDAPVPPFGGLFWRAELGNLLGLVATLNHSRQEPLLSSLVRQKSTGNVGPGYGIPVAEVYGIELDTPEKMIEHAKLEADKCFGFFWTVIS